MMNEGTQMKNGKRPTVNQRKFIQSKRLNSENWYVVKDTPAEMVLIHKHSNKTRTIKKGE